MAPDDAEERKKAEIAARYLGLIQFDQAASVPIPNSDTPAEPTPPSPVQRAPRPKLKNFSTGRIRKFLFKRKQRSQEKESSSSSTDAGPLSYDWIRHETVLREDQDWKTVLDQAQYRAQLETRKIEDHQVLAHLRIKKARMDALAAMNKHLHPASALGTQLTIRKTQSQLTATREQKSLNEALERGGHADKIPPFEFIDFIGKGTYGRVFAAWCLINNRMVAVKVIDVDSVDYKADPRAKDDSIAEIQHEAKVLAQLRGFRAENVNMILDTFVVHSQLWIVSELCAGGSVKTLMRATGEKLEEKYILPIIREMCKGLRAIHEAGIIHRDIKSSNIMILEEGGLQIIDFGIAATFDTKRDKRMTLIGTPHWMAPELHKRVPGGSVKYGVEVDVWGAGMVVYEMATGLPAHARVQGLRQLATALSQKPPRLSTQQGFSQGLCDLVEFMLQPTPENRPSMDDVLNHPYLANSEQSHPTVMLADLVSTYHEWEAAGGQRLSLFHQAGAAPAEFPEDIVSEDQGEWRFSRAVDYEELAKFQIDSHFDAPAARTEPQILPNLHVESAAESSSAQAQNNDQRQTTAFTPPASPRSHTAMADQGEESQTPIPDTGINNPAANESTTSLLDPAEQNLTEAEERAERGGRTLASIFTQVAKVNKSDEDGESDEDKAESDVDLSKPILSSSKSDLPLRNNNDGSGVHSKELSVPDAHHHPRAGSSADIDLANVGTIKQNRMLNKVVVGAGSSESSGSDNLEHTGNAAKKPKRDTMAWEPEWDNAVSAGSPPGVSSWKIPFNRPTFHSSEGNPEASASTPSRPVLHHAETAPVGGQLGGPARGSVASMLDMDALLGDAAWPASNTSNTWTQQADPSPQDEYLDAAGRTTMAGGEENLGIWASREVAFLTEEDIRARVEEVLNREDVVDQLERKDLMRGYLKLFREQKYGVNTLSNDTTNGDHAVVAHARTPSAPSQFPDLSATVLPPHPDVMASNAPADQTIAEVSRMIMEWSAELGAVDTLLEQRWGLSTGAELDHAGMEDYGMGNDDDVEDHDADVEGN